MVNISPNGASNFEKWEQEIAAEAEKKALKEDSKQKRGEGPKAIKGILKDVNQQASQYWADVAIDKHKAKEDAKKTEALWNEALSFSVEDQDKVTKAPKEDTHMQTDPETEELKRKKKGN